MGRALGTFCIKNLTSSKKRSWFIHPFGYAANCVPGGAPCFNESGIWTLGKIISGGIAWPDADPHTSRVCVLSLSPDVTPQTVFWPRFFKTLFLLLWTFKKPLSSALYTSIGLDNRFNLAKTAASFAKNLPPLCHQHSLLAYKRELPPF